MKRAVVAQGTFMHTGAGRGHISKMTLCCVGLAAGQACMPVPCWKWTSHVTWDANLGKGCFCVSNVFKLDQEEDVIHNLRTQEFKGTGAAAEHMLCMEEDHRFRALS